MKTNRILNQLLASTIICGAAISFASPAYAQDPADTNEPTTGPVENADPTTSATGEAGADQGDIVITGTRIPQPNLTSTSPVTVLNSQEVKLQGTTRTEDLINSLPQAFAGQGGNLANGATGTATVDLRSLGASRTLVLINGRRLQAGDPAQAVPVADINFIPAAIVRRVDVLTGGASSVYGADAVSGVVNFIMDTEFEGIRVDAQYSFYQHENNVNNFVSQEITRRGFARPGSNVADGGTIDLSVAIGASFDDGRGHVMAYATYRKLNAVLQGNRDYSTCALTAQTDRPGQRQSGAALHLRRFRHVGQRHLLHQPGRRHLPGRPEPDLHPRLDAVQLRAVQLFPAPGRALHGRRLRRLRDQRGVQAVPRGDVHGRPHGRPDRPVGQFRQHDHRSTATTRFCRPSSARSSARLRT